MIVISPDNQDMDCPTYCGVMCDWGWTVGSRPTQSKLFSPDSQDIDCPRYRGVMCDWGWTMGSRPIRIVGC